MSYSIYHNFFIKATPKEVFEAVSTPKHLDNWWTLKSSGKPKLGTTYNLNFTDKYDWYCQVSVCKPYEAIHFKMTNTNLGWEPTTFGFDLEEKDGGTYVRFAHKDWAKIIEEFKIASFCWAMLFNGLKNYLEKGVVIPFEERN